MMYIKWYTLISCLASGCRIGSRTGDGYVMCCSSIHLDNNECVVRALCC